MSKTPVLKNLQIMIRLNFPVIGTCTAPFIRSRSYVAAATTSSSSPSSKRKLNQNSEFLLTYQNAVVVILRRQLKSLDKPTTVRPKRPPTAFLLYLQDVRPKIVENLKKTNGDTTNKVLFSETAKKASMSWKALEKSEVERYNKLSLSKRKAFEKDFKNYLENRSPQDVYLEKIKFQIAKKLGKRVAKPLTDVNAPKKPLSAYVSFVQRLRDNENLQVELTGSKFTGLPQKEIFQRIGKAWRSLPAQEKQKYEARYESEVRAYREKLNNYKEQHGVKDFIESQSKSLAQIAKPKPKRKARRVAKKKAAPKRKVAKKVAKKPVKKAGAKVATKKNTKPALKKAGTKAVKKVASSKAAPKKKSAAAKKVVSTKSKKAN
ncbi:exp1-like protein [Lobulomyces angularis]|nr:exp1-like protein [Lobulomyces angularis]